MSKSSSTDDLERRHAWAGIIENIGEGLLLEARNGKTHVSITVAVLTLPDGQERVAYAKDEAGTGEGTAPVSHLVARAKAKLQPNEAIALELVDIALSEDGSWRSARRRDRAHAQRFWDDILTPEHILRLLAEAREARGKDVLVSVAVLTLPTGQKRVALADCKLGDREARRGVAAFLRRLRRMKMLRAGEKLERVLVRLTLSNAGWMSTGIHDPLPEKLRSI